MSKIPIAGHPFSVALVVGGSENGAAKQINTYISLSAQRRYAVGREPLSPVEEQLRRAILGEPLPLAVVDLSAVHRNVERVLAVTRAAQKKVRLATKSVRCPALISRVARQCGETLSGLMTYSARETAFLASEGHRDLILAYPTLQTNDLRVLANANRRGALAAVVVDGVESLEAATAASRAESSPISVVIDVDISYRPFGNAVHLGVRRSPLRSPDEASALAAEIRARALPLAGIMAYEAQIAGLPDNHPAEAVTNSFARALKRLSRRDVVARRKAVIDRLVADGFGRPPIVNGGGTGSLAVSAEDPSLTEVTVGSAFLPGHLLDAYRDLSFEPALYFALEVVRRPVRGIVTCHGGGYVASGDGRHRQPRPVFPEGVALLAHEGAGEVQTPLRLSTSADIAVGSSVFFRHAKSGELAEHFNSYLLVESGTIVERAATYRGLGFSFLG